MSNKLYDQIDLILWNEWDPIGSNDNIEARDEYRSYIKTILKMLDNEVDEFKLSAHLNQLRTVSMCVKENLKEDNRVARLLLNIQR